MYTNTHGLLFIINLINFTIFFNVILQNIHTDHCLLSTINFRHYFTKYTHTHTHTHTHIYIYTQITVYY